MATEALKKLRKLSCAELCEGKAVAVGLRCEDFSCCEDCAAARTRAASALLDEMEKRLMPEGMEWPSFENGEKVRIGSLYVDDSMTVHEVKLINLCLYEDGYGQGYVSDGKSFHYFDKSNHLKRPEPEDTQERIDEDAGKTPCEYFGRKGELCSDGDECPSLEMDCSCDAAKIRDLLRRQRAICEKEAGR